MQIGKNRVWVKPDKDIMELDGMSIEAPEQERWSLYGALLGIGDIVYNHRGSRRGYLANRLHVLSSQSSALYDNPDLPTPGCRVMYSYLVRSSPIDENGLIFPFSELYAWHDGEKWRALNGFLLIEVDQKERVEKVDGFEVVNTDLNVYGQGIVRIAGSPNKNYLHFKAWDDPTIVEGNRVLFNKNTAYRAEIINTLTDKETSLFVAQRKDCVGLHKN